MSIILHPRVESTLIRALCVIIADNSTHIVRARDREPDAVPGAAPGAAQGRPGPVLRVAAHVAVRPPRAPAARPAPRRRHIAA